MEETKFPDKAAKKLFARLESAGGNPLALPPVLQPTILLYAMQGMIDSGGIRYQLEGDFPFTPPYSVFSDAYRAIGAEGSAACFDQAIGMFPFPEPETKSEQRNAFMGSLNEDDKFFQLGKLLCGNGRGWQLMDKYVQKHHEAFDI